jgi:hypothetical protein
VGNFLASCKLVSFSRRTVLYGVSKARDKMNYSYSLRTPPSSASQNVLSCCLVTQSQWPCGLRCGSTAAHLLGLWFQIPPSCMSVCLLRVLCVVRYRFLLWADHSTREVLSKSGALIMGRSWPSRGCCTMENKNTFWHICTMHE